jgi:hypothetical protein
VKRESRNSNSFSLLLMFGVWNYRDAKSLLCVCMLCVLILDFFTSWLMMISPWYNLRDSRIWWQIYWCCCLLTADHQPKRFVIWVLSLSYYLQFLFCFLEVWAPFLFTIFVFEISCMVQVRRSIGLVSESVIYQFLVFWETNTKIPESGACCCTKMLNPIFQCMTHTMVWASHRGRDLKIQWFFFVGGLG